MITDTKIKILGYIRTNSQARVKDLVNHLGLGVVGSLKGFKVVREV